MIAACSSSGTPGSGTGGTDGNAGASGSGGAHGAGGAGIGGATGRGGSSLPASDEFNGTALDPSWTIFNPTLVNVTLGQGALSLKAVGDSFWYQNNTGVL